MLHKLSGHPDVISPAHSPRALRAIATAWESFIAYGEIRGPQPRPIILNRWQRCRELGINPLTERAPLNVAQEEIEAILRKELLGRVGKSILDSFASWVEGTGQVIVLADAQGRILYSVGQKAVQHRLERINFIPGATWSEGIVGPNGIGTPIALGRPEMVFGHEHYCQGWQPWVCYGSPVRDPDSGEIIGVVDITGQARGAHAEVLALTFAIAQSVEQQLRIFQLEVRDHLRARYHELARRWPSEGLVLLNTSGRVIEANTLAIHHLGLPSSALGNQPLAKLVPELGAAIAHLGASTTPREARVQLTSGAESGRRVMCRAEPIVLGERRLGVILILSDLLGAGAGTARSARTALSTPLRAKWTFNDIEGQHPTIQKTLALAAAAALDPRENPVLLLGETGTGKELVAHAIHAASARASGPLVIINCGALPRDLVESELFGYAPGAFTGARREGLIGKIEAAHKGTLFLDEVDSLPLELQAKFLRALEDREVTRLGSIQPVQVDVRIIAAASAALHRRLEAGEFRLDLYHRLSVIEVPLPPLRERGEDIVLLASSFLKRASLEAGRQPLTISAAAASYLKAYSWPGNIRELRNLCTRWVLTVTGSQVEIEDLPPPLRCASSSPRLSAGETPSGLRDLQDEIIERTLRETQGNVTEAARRLGIDKTTIYRRLKRSTKI